VHPKDLREDCYKRRGKGPKEKRFRRRNEKQDADFQSAEMGHGSDNIGGEKNEEKCNRLSIKGRRAGRLEGAVLKGNRRRKIGRELNDFSPAVISKGGVENVH